MAKKSIKSAYKSTTKGVGKGTRWVTKKGKSYVKSAKKTLGLNAKKKSIFEVKIYSPKVYKLGTTKGAKQRLGLIDSFGREVITKPLNSVTKLTKAKR